MERRATQKKRDGAVFGRIIYIYVLEIPLLNQLYKK